MSDTIERLRSQAIGPRADNDQPDVIRRVLSNRAVEVKKIGGTVLRYGTLQIYTLTTGRERLDGTVDPIERIGAEPRTNLYVCPNCGAVVRVPSYIRTLDCPLCLSVTMVVPAVKAGIYEVRYACDKCGLEYAGVKAAFESHTCDIIECGGWLVDREAASAEAERVAARDEVIGPWRTRYDLNG